MIGLSLSANWKNDGYDLILVIGNLLNKMVHYKLVKVSMNALRLAEVIMDTVMQQYGFPDSIISDCGAIFMSKFWFSLCYILGIKQHLSTMFHPQMNG